MQSECRANPAHKLGSGNSSDCIAECRGSAVNTFGCATVTFSPFQRQLLGGPRDGCGPVCHPSRERSLGQFWDTALVTSRDIK